jgi:capsular exopolysaccharide synthesis family protein
MKKDEVMDITYQMLRRNLDVSQSRNTSLIEIKVFSHEAVEAAVIANKIAEIYRTYRITNRMKDTMAGIRILESNLAEQTIKVTNLQQRLDVLRAKLSIPESPTDVMGSSGSLEREKLSRLSEGFVTAQFDFKYSSTKLEELRKLDRARLRQAILTAVPNEEVLPGLLNTLASTEQQLAQLRQDLSEEHPQVKRAVALRDLLQKQIEERLDGILTGLENTVEAAKARLETAQQLERDSKQKVSEEAGVTRDYYQLKRDLESELRIRDALYLRVIQERVDSSIPPASIVSVTDQARPALSPSKPNITVNLILGSVFGLIMGIGLAFFIEYLDTSVKTIDDVERSLQAPVMGVIPQNVELLMEAGPDSPHAEAYRVLRTNVLFSRKRPDANSLTVVSGGAGEGKSTTICNLATVFAQHGQRILLVDSDLRRPSLHRFFKVSNSIGLTNYLLKQNTLEEVVQTTKNPLLDFLPSGKLPSSSVGILNSQRMKEFIQDVKQRYDFVFFDSPPIMGVSDASILASEVDLAILVVQYRKYPQAMTLRAKQMVEKVGGNLLGVVLNNINISQDSYYYYYSGYYYDYYSKNTDAEAKDKPKGQKAA